MGPLTNLGLAQSLQECLNQVKIISVNGGQSCAAGTTRDSQIQANFAHDPLATHILIQSRKLLNKVYLNPLELTLRQDWRQTLAGCLNGDCFGRIKQFLTSETHRHFFWGEFLAGLPLLRPDLLESGFHVYAEIVRDSSRIDGLLAINWLKTAGGQATFPNRLFIYHEISRQRANQVLAEAMEQNP